MSAVNSTRVPSGRHAVIVGAGKIGRGFLAHLCFAAGWSVTFVESNCSVAEELRRAGSYRLRVLSRPPRTELMEGFAIHDWSETAAITSALGTADLVLTAVGGQNLREVASELGSMLHARIEDVSRDPLNIITCENWVHPAGVMREGLLAPLGTRATGSARGRLGVSEAIVLRSCMEPTAGEREQDPFSLRVQDFWELPVDASGLALPAPILPGVVAEENFAHALERKLYTYNAASATMAFLGIPLGLTYLHEASGDPDVSQVVAEVLEESSEAVCAAYGYDRSDQRRFCAQAIAKYSNPDLADTLERQVRDPVRKLAPADRLVGAASLCLEHDVEPRSLCLAIAAGIRYENPDDPSACQMASIRQEGGTAAVLSKICGLEAGSTLARMVTDREPDLERLWLSRASARGSGTPRSGTELP